MATPSPSPTSDLISPADIIIPIMGASSPHKSTFIAACTNFTPKSPPDKLAHSNINISSFSRRGYRVRLIDVPNFSSNAPAATLNEIVLWLGMGYAQKPRVLCAGIVYLLPTGEAVSAVEKQSFRTFGKLCGRASFPAVVLATNAKSCEEACGQVVSRRVFWGDMMDGGSSVFQIRQDHEKEDILKIVDYIIDRESRVVLLIQQQLIKERRRVRDTDVGHELLLQLMAEKETAEERLLNVGTVLRKMLREDKHAEAEFLVEQQEEYGQIVAAKERSIEALNIDITGLWMAKREAKARRDEQRRQAGEYTERGGARAEQHPENYVQHQLDAFEMLGSSIKLSNMGGAIPNVLGGFNIGGSRVGPINLGGLGVGGVDVGSYNVGGGNVGTTGVGNTNIGSGNVGGTSAASENIGGGSFGGTRIHNSSFGRTHFGGRNIGGSSFGSRNFASTNLGSFGVGNLNLAGSNIGNPGVGGIDVGRLNVANPSIGSTRVGKVGVANADIASPDIAGANFASPGVASVGMPPPGCIAM